MEMSKSAGENVKKYSNLCVKQIELCTGIFLKIKVRHLAKLTYFARHKK